MNWEFNVESINIVSLTIKKMKNESVLHLRRIQPTDNQSLAKIIRSSLAEFGADHPGTVFFDPTTDALYELFREERSAYFVAEYNRQIVGGGGIFPTRGLPADTCELVKMYLIPEVRGKRFGSSIIRQCLKAAADIGFGRIYLESMPELKQALKVYEKFGFEYLTAPLGNTGHFGCDLWMLRQL